MSKTKITVTGEMRLCDAYGCGHFGASRGNRKHKGTDYLIKPNGAVLAPWDCEVIRHGYPYAHDLSYRLIECKGLGSHKEYTFKMMYVKDLPKVGTVFKRLSVMCLADDLGRMYGKNMPNHVHFELYKNGVLIDPQEILK